VTAEYRASGEGFPQMPDDNTPGMTLGNSLDGNRRTHRVKYRGEDVTLRMPSAAAMKRFAAQSEESTFDVPVGAEYPDTSGVNTLVAGWVRVTGSPNGNWTAIGMGFPGGADGAVAEGVASILEARRPSHALRDAGSLIAKHRDRQAAQGVPLRAVSSAWISALGYDDATGVMATQTAAGGVYGHLVSKATFGEVASAKSPGSMFNKLVKGSGRVEVGNCPSCGRFFAASGSHSCPTPSAPKFPAVRNVAAQGYATAALSQRANAPAPPARPVRTIHARALMASMLERRAGKTGMFGAPGWTIPAVADQIAPFTSSEHTPAAYVSSTGYPKGNGDGDSVIRFAGLPAVQARTLLGRLTRGQLADRVGGGPSTGSLLQAAAANPGTVEVHGFAVGPDRNDERLALEGIFIYDEQLTDEAAVKRDAWSKYGLGDAAYPPDQITQVVNPWRPGEKAWRLWWD